MDDNIIQFGGAGTKGEPKDDDTFREYTYTVNYVETNRLPITVRGFLTVMGGYYFIGRGKRNDIDWMFSCPSDKVHSIVVVPDA